MTIEDVVREFLEDLVDAEAQALLPAAAKSVPGIAGLLLTEALQLAPVQAELRVLEGKGIDFLLVEGEKAFAGLKALVLGHLHGRIGAVVAQGLDGLRADLPLPHLTADEVRAIAQLVVVGKLHDALRAGLLDLGLPFPIPQPAPVAP